MKNNENRIKQTIHFIKWTKKYNGWWQLICEPGNEHMNLEMMQLLIKRLAKESCYEIIFVLLEVHKNEEFMKSVKDVLLNNLYSGTPKKRRGKPCHKIGSLSDSRF